MIKLSAIILLCVLLAGCTILHYEELPYYSVCESYIRQIDEPLYEQYSDFEHRVFERVNNERTIQGLAPLVWHDTLADVARTHSRNMAQAGGLSVASPYAASTSERVTNAGIPWRRTMAFIMRGRRLTPETISLPEVEVLYASDYTHVGIGFYRTTESVYERYVTFKFISMPIRPSSETIREWEQYVLDLTNEYRAIYGLSPLIWEDALAYAARLHSVDMAYNNFMSHEGSDGSRAGKRVTRTGWAWRIVKENVARGQHTPYIVVQEWIDSPGHRENILSEDVTYLGIGFYFLLEDSQYYFHWTQKFGAPLIR